MIAIETSAEGAPLAEALLAGLCGEALDPRTGTVTMASLGGYLTARNVKKIAPSRLRGIVVLIGLALSAWCAWHALH